MAIVKFNNRKMSTTDRKINKLRRVIDYVTDANKTQSDLVGGIGVDKENALERMQLVKDYYNKSGGREYIHFCISFKGNQDAYTVYDIAEIIAGYYDEYQVLFAVHTNTDNTHVHFVLNTVRLKDGLKFSQSKSDLEKFKTYFNSIIERSGLSDSIIDEECYYDLDSDEYDDFEEEADLIEAMEFYEDKPLTVPMFFDVEKLQERGENLDEEYIKRMRYAEMIELDDNDI